MFPPSLDLPIGNLTFMGTVSQGCSAHCLLGPSATCASIWSDALMSCGLSAIGPLKHGSLMRQLTAVNTVDMAHCISAPAAGNEVAKNINKNNAQHAIVFEAVSLALAMDADTELLQASVSLLGKFISVREPNIKYLGLENMVRLAEVPAVIDTIHR